MHLIIRRQRFSLRISPFHRLVPDTLQRFQDEHLSKVGWNINERVDDQLHDRMRIISRGVSWDAQSTNCGANVFVWRRWHPSWLFDLGHICGHESRQHGLNDNIIPLVLDLEIIWKLVHEGLCSGIDREQGVGNCRSHRWDINDDPAGSFNHLKIELGWELEDLIKSLSYLWQDNSSHSKDRFDIAGN